MLLYFKLIHQTNHFLSGTLGVLLLRLVCGHFPKPRDRQMINDDIWWEPGLSKGEMAFITTKKTNCVFSLVPGGPTSWRV